MYDCLKEVARQGTDEYQDRGYNHTERPKELGAAPAAVECWRAEQLLLSKTGTPNKVVWNDRMNELKNGVVLNCRGNRVERLAVAVEIAHPRTPQEIQGALEGFPDAITALKTALTALKGAHTSREKDARIKENPVLWKSAFQSVLRVLYFMELWIERDQDGGPSRSAQKSQYGRVLARWYYFISTDGESIPKAAARAPKRARTQVNAQGFDVTALPPERYRAETDAGIDAGINALLQSTETVLGGREPSGPEAAARQGSSPGLPSPAGAGNSPGAQAEMADLTRILPRVSPPP